MDYINREHKLSIDFQHSLLYNSGHHETSSLKFLLPWLSCYDGMELMNQNKPFGFWDVWLEYYYHSERKVTDSPFQSFHLKRKCPRKRYLNKEHLYKVSLQKNAHIGKLFSSISHKHYLASWSESRIWNHQQPSSVFRHSEWKLLHQSRFHKSTKLQLNAYAVRNVKIY